jgi:hypothetical protein
MVALIGCQDPISDTTVTETVPAINGPAGLNGKKLEGGVLLYWETVPDAKGYQVYRHNDDTGEEKELTGESKSALYYLDLVDWDNLLTAGTYTYKVVAVSGFSGNDRAAEGVVFNGTSTYTVTFEAADIPERTATSLPWIKVDDPTVADGPVGKRLVLATAPNLDYTVKVALGAAVDGDVFYYLDDTVGTAALNSTYPFSNYKYVDIPEIGGDSTVEITAGYYYEGYYPQTAVKRTTVTQDAGLNTPQSFVAQRSGDTKQYVGFMWTNDPQATGYTIYKAEIDIYSTLTPPPPCPPLQSNPHGLRLL